MIKFKKKLALAAETIVHLRADQLHDVGGGQTFAQCSTICSDRFCPDTRFIHGCASHTFEC